MKDIKNVTKKLISCARKPKTLYVRMKRATQRHYIRRKYGVLTTKGLLPRSLFIEVTGLCNLHCTICHRSYIKEELSAMTLNTFVEVAKIFPFVESVSLMGIGEPLTNKRILTMVSMCKSHGLSVGFNSNGVLLTSNLIRGLISSGLDNFVFSVDGATKETYERIRVGSDFDRVIDNIVAFFEMKEKLGRKNPTLGLEFVVTTRNIHELLPYINLAKNTGIGRIVVSHVITFSAKQKGETLYNHIDPTYQKLWDDAMSKARNLGIHLVLPQLQPLENSKCRFKPWENFFVSWKGDIKPCCTYLHPLPLFYDGKEVKVPVVNLGNVHKENILKLWYSSNYSKFRDQILTKEYTDICKNCLYSKELIPS